MRNTIEMDKYNNIIIVYIIYVYKDCLLRSTPSPASVKQNGLEGIAERDGEINRYLVKSARKPILMLSFGAVARTVL